MEVQDSTVCFLYNNLRVETIRCLEEYVRNGRGTLGQLKERFRGYLPEEELKRVRSVKKLVDGLEKKGVIGNNNVKLLKMLAEKLGIQELKQKVEEFETDCEGIFKKTLNAAAKASGFVWEKFKGGVCTSAVHLKAVLSIKGVQILAVTAIGSMYGMNPESLLKFIALLELGAQVVAILRGSVVFVLKFSSISSLKLLWKRYRNGFLKENLKKAFNEMEEFKELSQGQDIDVEVEIDEEEYREVLLDLILLETKGYSMKNTKRQRRHSVCCERDVPKDSSKVMDVTQIKIRVGRPVTELEKSINFMKRVEKAGSGWLSRMAREEEQRLSEIQKQLSEMEIFLAAAGFSEIRLEEVGKKSLTGDVTKSKPLVKEESFEKSGYQTSKSIWLSSAKEPLLGCPTEVKDQIDTKRSKWLGLPESPKERRGNTIVLGDIRPKKPNRELKLRDYQKELAAPALEGKNTIICAPNNSGRTFVAMEIVKRHIDGYKTLTSKLKILESPKVIFVVDKQNLLIERTLLFKEYLTNYNISAISGRHSDVNPLHRLIQDNDIIVLTAPILVNALRARSVSITDVTLLMFDECHHANKDHPYNQIMQEYLKTKLYGEHEATEKIPQVVGLTAHLGANTKEHVLQMCANLDAELPYISTASKKSFFQKKPNIFEEEVNKAMEEIEAFMDEAPPRATNRQSESYLEWIELLEQKGNHLTCKSLLRCYHEALLINSNVRIEDAILRLDEYSDNLDESKFTQTEPRLRESFLKVKERIEKHIQEAGQPENPLLINLQKLLIYFHTNKVPKEHNAGILFTSRREFAIALKKWIEETAELKEILRPEVLTAGQQEQVIQKFNQGTFNIIIATKVAEEGLDISKCNYVIRYGMRGNEISSVQAPSRTSTKQHKQQKAKKTMQLELVLGEINNIRKNDFLNMIKRLQLKSVASKKQTLREDADGVTFLCKKCNALVCNAQDIRRFKEAHHVVINKEIYERIDIKPHKKPRTYGGIQFNKKIYCKACGFDWGVIITVEGTEWPCLKVISFVTTLNHGKVRKHFKKWKGLPFKICDITLEEMIEAEHEEMTRIDMKGSVINLSIDI